MQSRNKLGLIRQVASLVSELQQERILEGDPVRKRKLEQQIEEQKRQLQELLPDYIQICHELGEPIPRDILEEAIVLGISVEPLEDNGGQGQEIEVLETPGMIETARFAHIPSGDSAIRTLHFAHTPSGDIESRSLALELQLLRTADGLHVRSSSQLTGESPWEPVNLPEDLPSTKKLRDSDVRRELGEKLYRGLFAGQAGSALDTFRSQARIQGTSVALQLRFDENAVESSRWPWELVHDGRQYLVLSDADLTRYIAFPQAIVPVRVEPPLEVVLVAASPAGTDRIDVDVARQVLETLPNIRVDPVSPPTYHRLLKRLMPFQPPVHVFDFEGHGYFQGGQGFLCFEDKAGELDLVSAEALGVALAGRQIALAVLNACHGAEVGGESLFGSVAPALILAGVPAVIGMQGPIKDRVARDFLEALYENISHYVPVTVALSHARKFLYESGEWYKPVLYLRSTDQTGQIFQSRE